jgi:predicted DNA-binding transcriptional regulator YafY
MAQFSILKVKSYKMSKRGYISRYLLILKKLKAKPYSTFEEIQDYIERQVDFLQMQDDSLLIGFSKRTFQRDLKEIRNNFGVEIEFSRTLKGYWIVQNETENMNFQRMMEAFDMFNSLNLAQDLKPYVQLENRTPQGTENLYGLLHAIKNKLTIEFSHKKFWEVESTNRTAEPYALKEYKNRWYLIANDLKDQTVKTFALDRLTELHISRNSFVFPLNFDLEEKFRFCFGISNPNGLTPEVIELQFDPDQGKYIKSLPLHGTQEILVDNEMELRISLKLCITYDLIMELLSFGDTVKVIKPPFLVETLKQMYLNALAHYSDSD